MRRWKSALNKEIKMSMSTKETITDQLKQLGVVRGGVLLVHSSLRMLGPVSGGAETVCDALLDALGPEGTLLMPGFQGGGEYVMAAGGVCFDAAKTPSDCGFLTEFFRQRKRSIRSLSPTHSITGAGPLAAVLLAGHEHCRVTAGWGSPFQKMIEHDGRILMLGASRASNTMMHFLENTGGAPTVCSTLFQTSVITNSGETLSTPIYPHMPGLRRNYPRAIDLLEKAGGMSSGKVGEAVCELYSCRMLQKVVYDALAKNPCAFIHVFTPSESESVV